jgi:hypothetical protein
MELGIRMGAGEKGRLAVLAQRAAPYSLKMGDHPRSASQ